MKAVIFIFFFISFSFSFNINSSFHCNYINLAAKRLLNRSSLIFKDNYFIFFLLYGNPTANFTLDELSKTYRKESNNPYPGFLILSKDLKSVGVFSDNSSFILPVKNKNIQRIPNSHIFDYFPQGYIIKDTCFDIQSIEFTLKEVQIENETNLCSNFNCSGTFRFESKTDYLSENEFLIITLKFSKYYEIYLIGYVTKFTNKGGEFKLNSYLFMKGNHIFDVDFFDFLEDKLTFTIQDWIFLKINGPMKLFLQRFYTKIAFNGLL